MTGEDSTKLTFARLIQNSKEDRVSNMDAAAHKNASVSKAYKVRDLVLLQLRQDGYPLSEIANLLGFSRQRAAQIYRRLVDEASTEWQHPTIRTLAVSRSTRRASVHAVTDRDFSRRLERLNNYFEARVRRVLKHLHKRQLLNVRRRYISTTMFWRVWPLIEAYEGKPFSFSQLVADHPELLQEKHLAQFLSRLRRKGLLAKAGLLRFSGHNLPEVLMVERPQEQTCSRFLEPLFSRWSRELRRIDARFRVRNSQSLRQDLLNAIAEFGFSENDLDTVVRVRHLPERHGSVAPKAGQRKRRTASGETLSSNSDISPIAH